MSIFKSEITRTSDGSVNYHVMLERGWMNIESAPTHIPIMMMDMAGYTYPGEYNHMHSRFDRYTNHGLVSHDHAELWKPLPL